MSKYDPLWEYVRSNGPQKLSFEEVGQITGFPIDHSFLKFKKELEGYDYQVDKISMKKRTVQFRPLKKS